MTATFQDLPELLTEDVAAKMLTMSVQTLQRWRWEKKGPVFYKVGGAVRYTRADLLAYLSDCRRTTLDTNKEPS